jgi:hypothetical protein
MTEPLRPWADHQILQDILARQRAKLAGRALFRVSAGSDWLRLNLDGPERPALWLTWLPGANLVFSSEGPVPETLQRALPVVRRHPLTALLKETSLARLGMLAGDRVAALCLQRADGSNLFLLHQLYGARGNTVLLDEQARLLWSRRRPPAALLGRVPPEDTWATGEAAGNSAGNSAGNAPGRGDLVCRLALGHLVTRLTNQHLQRCRTALGRTRRSSRRLVDNLQRDFDRAERSEHYRRQAEALAANLHLIRPGQDRLDTADLRDGHRLEIPLDPAQSPAASMEALFRKARKAEKGRDIILQRLEDAAAHADQLDLAAQRLEDVAASPCEDIDCLTAVLDWQDAHAGLLPATGAGAAPIPGHGPEEPARPFRRYLIDGKYQVWVGRSNQENDELTHRASHARDIWLHAQGVPGSHVIVRTAGKPENLPRTILEKAAALAALNSKARHSSLVPVIYTERRYVRKPRKSPPGTAACLQEKSIFVEPGIAPGVQGI